jgi:hypothetical protein
MPVLVCPTVYCGARSDTFTATTAPRGWVRLRVSGSLEPARWYCSGVCAGRGLTAAQARMRPVDVEQAVEQVMAALAVTHA